MTVRVVLRLSDFPAEVVFSFDVDCACVDDGTSVWALHRAPQTGVNIMLNPLHAWPNRPTYESRFVKYARCGFAVAALALSSWMCSRFGELGELQPALHACSSCLWCFLLKMIVIQNGPRVVGVHVH